VLQSHVAKDGTPKLVAQLTLPATALGCANRVITELGVFDTAGDCFICVMRAEGVTQETIERATGARVLFTTITAGRR
jgi:acyl CoA:acetate/3-ketoacid CoA transferase beta subunit